MRAWPVQDAKARFSEMLETARLMHCRTDDLIEDAMIAATAAIHRLTIATRNVRDFESFGVPTFNPFAMKAG
jgi:predicted nucleic acid-binding protein